MRSDQELKLEGFTDSGIMRYHRTTDEFSEFIFKTAVVLAERDKMDGSQREVTHEHVRDATNSASRVRKQTSLQLWCQVGEYICAVTAGIGGGKLEQQWGIVTLALSLVIGIALFIWRNNQR